MALKERTKAQLKLELETAIRETADVENVDALISAAFGQLDWDDLACKILDDVVDEENTDRLIDLLFPKIEAVLERVLGRFSFVLSIPFVNPKGRLRESLDDALPDLIRDPLKDMLCSGEGEG